MAIILYHYGRDTLYSGLRFRILNIINGGVREVLDIVVNTSIPAVSLVRVLEQLKAQRGLPEAIRVDNGPEMTAQMFASWDGQNWVKNKPHSTGKTESELVHRAVQSE